MSYSASLFELCPKGSILWLRSGQFLDQLNPEGATSIALFIYLFLEYSFCCLIFVCLLAYYFLWILFVCFFFWFILRDLISLSIYFILLFCLFQFRFPYAFSSKNLCAIDLLPTCGLTVFSRKVRQSPRQHYMKCTLKQ